MSGPDSEIHIRNAILSSFEAAVRAMLAPHLRRRLFRPEETLATRGAVSQCLFVESGIVSLNFGADHDTPVEVGIVGPEGMLGIAAILGNAGMPNAAVAITCCEVLAVEASILRSIAASVPEAGEVMLRYANQRLARTMQISACHLRHQLEPRLASWILEATAMSASTEIAITHRQLARLLGTARPSMTLAIQVLEGERAIRATRGLLVVRDRERLRQLACGCYQLRERVDITGAEAAPLPPTAVTRDNDAVNAQHPHASA